MADNKRRTVLQERSIHRKETRERKLRRDWLRILELERCGVVGDTMIYMESLHSKLVELNRSSVRSS